MPFDWKDYYSLAERLRVENQEASLRSAISRVYYSLFCQARNHLLQSGVELPQFDSVHRFVWNYYRRNDGRTYNAIGLNGGRLHLNRNVADYEDEIERLSQMVDESFQYATNLRYYLGQLK